MTAHTIQLSEKIYGLLLKQAARLQMTPEEVLERVLASDLALLTDAIDQDTLSLDEPAATMRRSRRVQRLSTLFADVSMLILTRSSTIHLALEHSTLLDFSAMSKTFSDIPDQAAVMLDANIVVYALGTAGPLAYCGVRLLERGARRELTLHLVIQAAADIQHRVMVSGDSGVLYGSITWSSRSSPYFAERMKTWSGLRERAYFRLCLKRGLM